nr:DNA mismatch repair protein MSH4 [Tanacetum cinerariifolium]
TSQGSIEYGGQSYSEPLGAFTTGHPYIKDWNGMLRTRLICANLLQPLKDTINARLDYLVGSSVTSASSQRELLIRIGEGIDEDVLHAGVHFVARTQQFFAVKDGIDGFLDIERRSFCDTNA